MRLWHVYGITMNMEMINASGREFKTFVESTALTLFSPIINKHTKLSTVKVFTMAVPRW